MRPLLLFICLLLPFRAIAEPPRVVADLPPVHSLAAMVMGDLGTPDLLLDGRQDPHYAQLRPSQSRKLARADLILWVGPGLTPWLAGALDGLGVKDRALPLLAAAGTIARAPWLDGDADYGHAHDGSDPDHVADTDPHAWLDPVNAAAWIAAIEQALAAADPENAAVYRANAGRAQAELVALSGRITARLAPAAGRPLAVYHDGYAHLADRFGLTVVASLTDGAATPPGAASAAALRGRLTGGEIACLLTEAHASDALARRLVEGTGAKAAVLDPLGGLLTPGPALYGEMLDGMARAIADCAGPGG